MLARGKQKVRRESGKRSLFLKISKIVRTYMRTYTALEPVVVVDGRQLGGADR
jgi:hypothetical protein